MAPSRALTRPVAALISLRLPSSTPRRTLSAVSRARVVPAQACLNAHTFVYSPLSCRRLSSVSSPSPSPSPSPSSPEPPDYLSEGELAIFNKLKAQLDPTSLEVRGLFLLISSYPPSMQPSFRRGIQRAYMKKWREECIIQNNLEFVG